ncbi:hypothetical protein N7492_007790 [Penicillium capsulatum]|uniref:Transcription factor Rba50 n=1 Tax=Penicillium capsulatum TaxID=69766 RepID=A0A9W9I0G2_9EURO|nr:hypothetical protein N7492_007790 [Penicillium capsulatum]KAJ6117621.1 hypothetical protein N7512_007346 [Penicillium capsulatum]
MAFRGERFVLDLDDDDVHPPEEPEPSPFSLIGEIREREPSAATPPAPTPPTVPSSTGFPAHRRRNKPSSFKQRRAEQAAPEKIEASPTVQNDKQHIAEENRRHLASLSDAQIEQEREELMASMDPGLLERFLRRAKIDENENEKHDAPASKPPVEPKAKKSVSFAPATSSEPTPKPTTQKSPPAPSTQATSTPASNPPVNDDRAPAQVPSDLHPAAEKPSLDPAMIEKFHFPQPKQPMPTLDPSSPEFLSQLKSHYFPEISHDPSALSWLQNPSGDEEDPDSTSAYHPASNAVSLAPSAIRFSLRGTLLSPTTSLSLPTSLGLHHHGEDPQAAGYTIPELAILSRSTFPAQRCVAWQVLGRILFRLGRAEFGDRGGQLSEGLWFVIEKEGVVAGMLTEAEGATSQSHERTRMNGGNEKNEARGGSNVPVASGLGRHASAAAWAVEGVWLWQKGGGGDRGLLKEGQVRSQ